MIALYLLFCIGFAAFFAGMETGLLSANRMILQENAERGMIGPRAAEFLLSRPERLLGVTLIGYNVANVTAAVLFTNFLVSIGWEEAVWLGMLGLTFLLLIFNDLVPKSFLRRSADSVAVRMAPVLLILYFAFSPLLVVLNSLVRGILFLTGQYASRREELTSKRDVRFLIGLVGKEAGLPHPDRQIIEDIFDFRDQAAHEVMIPFHELPALSIHHGYGDVAALAHETGQRFIPIFRGRADNVVGYVDSQELLSREESPLAEVMKTAVFYPEVRRIPDLLMEMNRKGLDVVFLADEYGGFAGMITPGQIVGDLVHYIPEEGVVVEEIRRVASNLYRVSGKTDLEDVSRRIGVHLRRGFNTTIGGYVSEKLGVIPEEGAVYREGGYRFRVVQTGTRHIEELEVEREG